MNNSGNSRSWALAGPITVALWIAGLFLLTQNQPGDHATGRDILGWYGSHTEALTQRHRRATASTARVGVWVASKTLKMYESENSLISNLPW